MPASVTSHFAFIVGNWHARHEPSVFEIVAGPYFLLLFWTNLRWWRFGRGGKGPFIGGPGDVVPALATRVIYSSFWLAVIALKISLEYGTRDSNRESARRSALYHSSPPRSPPLTGTTW